ncbi:MAG: hypothetical protein EBY24_23230, partial [Betaproteobacteria bacterium]|nr:hypothetical protein [Betaproteobacteria bacterium]
KVIFDPWSVDTDGADSTFAYVLAPVSLREFERRWKGKDALDFGDAEQSKKDDARKSVMLAESWEQKDATRKVIVYTDANGEEADATQEDYEAACMAVGAQLPVTRIYSDKTTEVMWRRMSGVDILEEVTYPADSIGVVPVYGYIGFANGRMKYCGIPRRARNPQQAYNYHISEQLAYIATAPKAPWLVSKRAAAGVEDQWDRASTQSRAWLPYNDIDDDGAIAAPNRISPTTSLTNHESGAMRALADIEAAVAMYRANLGAPSNETSGVAIDARKQQGEASNAHFPSHLQASLGRVGDIVLQMDARLSDTRRKVPIIGVDGSPGSVVFDPEQDASFKRDPDGACVNPSVGSYGVRVVIGASYSTQRAQTNAAFGEIMRTSPQLAQIVAPFWAQTLDFPGSEKFAQAMAAMAPAPVKAILQPEGQDKGPDPAELSHQLDQCKQALQEAIQHAHDAQSDADA